MSEIKFSDGMVERWRETEEEAVAQWNRRVNNE